MIKNLVKVISLSANQRPALVPAESFIDLPNVTLQNTPGATQFSAFAECSERGIKILASEGEGAFCHEPGEVSRKDNHQKMLEVILAALRSK